MFYTDNQGPWNGACGLKHLMPGGFVRPSRRLQVVRRAGSAVPGAAPPEPKSGSRMMTEAKQIPELVPPAVFFPYPKMGQSASGIACDLSGGKFGPFEKQMFVGDQSHSTVMRVVPGEGQRPLPGGVLPVPPGLRLGQSCRCASRKDGSLFVGGTNRGWGSRGAEAVRPRAPRLDRQDAVRDPRDARQARRLRADLHQARRPADGRRPEVVHDEDVHLHLPADYGSPEVDQTTPTIDRRRRSPPTARACGCT